MKILKIEQKVFEAWKLKNKKLGILEKHEWVKKIEILEKLEKLKKLKTLKNLGKLNNLKETWKLVKHDQIEKLKKQKLFKSLIYLKTQTLKNDKQLKNLFFFHN